MDTHDANISVKIEYRVQGQTPGTTVLAAGSGQRIVVQDLAIEFYNCNCATPGQRRQRHTSRHAAISAQYSMEA
jgi:hypothetical protein